MEPTLASHISIRPEVCGGKPCVGGTRIRVWDIHVMHHLEGRSPTEILTAYPQLSLADVHAALAYYLDHRQEIEAQMERADTEVARLEAEHGPTRFSELRDALLRRKDDGEDPVSS
jgi:uncharacterized protein (DUF433 family)